MRYGDDERRVELTGRGDTAVVVEGDTAFVDVDGQSLELSLATPPSVDEAVRHASVHAGGSATLTAPMPGRVLRLLVKPGDEVALRQGLVVIEAMKMENELGAPKAGRVTEVAVTEGTSVEAGRLLVVIE